MSIENLQLVAIDQILNRELIKGEEAYLEEETWFIGEGETESE